MLPPADLSGGIVHTPHPPRLPRPAPAFHRTMVRVARARRAAGATLESCAGPKGRGRHVKSHAPHPPVRHGRVWRAARTGRGVSKVSPPAQHLVHEGIEEGEGLVSRRERGEKRTRAASLKLLAPAAARLAPARPPASTLPYRHPCACRTRCGPNRRCRHSCGFPSRQEFTGRAYWQKPPQPAPCAVTPIFRWVPPGNSRCVSERCRAPERAGRESPGQGSPAT